MAYPNNGLQNAMNQAQSSAYANAAGAPKQPTVADSISKEIREQLSGIEHHIGRLEGVADRLCGTHPQAAATGGGAPPPGNSYADKLVEFRGGLIELGARLNEALNRLESFI